MSLKFACSLSIAIATIVSPSIFGQNTVPTADNPFGSDLPGFRVARSILVPVIQADPIASQRETDERMESSRRSPGENFQSGIDSQRDETFSTFMTLPSAIPFAPRPTTETTALPPLVMSSDSSDKAPIAAAVPDATNDDIDLIDPFAASVREATEPIASNESSGNREMLPTDDFPVPQPQKSTGESMQDQVIVHEPVNRSAAPHRFYFRVENPSEVAASDVVVEVSVDAPANIIEVVPYETAVEGRTAHFRIPSLPPNADVTLELTVTPTSASSVAFKSNVISAKEEQLDTSFIVVPAKAWASNRRAARAERGSLAESENIAADDQSLDIKISQEQSLPPILVPDRSRTVVGNSSVPPRARSSVATKTDKLQNVSQMHGRLASEIWTQQRYGINGKFTAFPAGTVVRNPFVDVQASETERDTHQTHNATASIQKPIGETMAAADIVPDLAAPSGDFQLQAAIRGPQHAVSGEENEYEVVVTNTHNIDAKDVLIQLHVPTGLRVTTLDRDAWFDDQKRTATWHLSKLTGGQSETIRYLAVVRAEGSQRQQITLGMNDSYQGQAEFESIVIQQHHLAAPLLPFEKVTNSLK